MIGEGSISAMSSHTQNTLAEREKALCKKGYLMADILDFTKPHVLRNEEEYDCAVAEIDTLLDTDPQPGTEAYERLEFLSVLVQAYEDTHVPVYEQSTPQEVVNFMLEQKGLSRDDLTKWLGSSSQTAEFFEGSRSLSIEQIGALRAHLGIPADLLIEVDVG